MGITLNAELEARIQRKLDTGRFRSASDVLSDAMYRLEEDEFLVSPDGADFFTAIEEGWQAAERGDTVSAEEAREHLARARAARTNP